MQVQNTSAPEMEQEQTATAEKPQKSQIQSLADMFREEPAEKAEAEESSASGGTAEKHQQVKPSKAFNDLAEKLGVKPEDLYALEVTLDGGTKKTISQLKDIARTEGDLSVRELAIEEDRTKKEAEFFRVREELNELISALPQNALKPEVLNAVRQKHEAKLKRARAETLELIPEWQNEAKRTEEIGGIIEHLKGYGFPPAYLQQIFDARALKYIRENFLREQRLRKALDQVQPAKPATTSKSRPAGGVKKPSSGSKQSSYDGGSARFSKLFE